MANGDDEWTPQNESAVFNSSALEEKSRGSTWGDPEMQALLVMLKEEVDTDSSEFHSSYRKGPFYKKLSDRLASIGFSRRGEQIQTKIKKWKAQYINVMRQRAAGKRVTCRYYKELAAVFAHSVDVSSVVRDDAGVATTAASGNEDDDDFVEIDFSNRSSAALRSSQRGFFKWTGPEIELVLQFWASPEVQTTLDNLVHNKVVFEQIAEQMQEAGYERNAFQCLTKIKSLKKRYWLVERTRRSGGTGPKTFVGFEIIRRVMLTKGESSNSESCETPNHFSSRDSVTEPSQRQQHSSSMNSTAKRIVQRSVALQQRLSQRSNDTETGKKRVYPSPENVELVHITLEDQAKPEAEETSFMLDNGLLKLDLLRDEFNISRIKLRIGTRWVHLTEDDNGYIPLTFSNDSNFTIRESKTSSASGSTFTLVNAD